MPDRIRSRETVTPPGMQGFKPFGIPLRSLESTELLFGDYEAIRLADYEDLTQVMAALKMNISPPAFTRLYDKARKKAARAFFEGKAILINGGSCLTDQQWCRCNDCHTTTISDQPVLHFRNCSSENIKRISE